MNDKHCPYCGKEMIEGYVNGPAENFQFFPMTIKPAFWRTRWSLTEGAILIKEFKFFTKEALRRNLYRHDALMCSDCNKIILEISK